MIYHGRLKGDFVPDLSDLGQAVTDAIADLQGSVSAFDSIVTQGMSGVMVASPVAVALAKPLVIVRKDDDICHAPEKVLNLSHAGERWLFLDDFISCGNTRKRVKDAMPRKLTFAGSYLYANRELELTGQKPRHRPGAKPPAAKWAEQVRRKSEATPRRAATPRLSPLMAKCDEALKSQAWDELFSEQAWRNTLDSFISQTLADCAKGAT